MKIGLLNEKLRLLSKVKTEYVRLGSGEMSAANDMAEMTLFVDCNLDTMISSKHTAILDLEADDTEVVQQKGSLVTATATLHTLDPIFYPGFGDSNEEIEAFTVNSEVMKEGFQKTHYIASGERNPLFDAINWRSGVMLSTDQRSISAFKLPAKFKTSLNIPKAITPLLNIFKEENVTVKVHPGIVSFTGKAGVVKIRRIGGDFPDILKFIKPVTDYIQVNTEELLVILKKCVAIQALESEEYTTLVEFNDAGLTLSAKGSLGTVKETLKTEGTLEASHNYSTRALVNIISSLQSKATRLYLDRQLYISDSEEEVVLLQPMRII